MNNSTTQNEQVFLIDKFLVPAAAEEEFKYRMKFNRNFIRTQPGFVGDAAYEHRDQDSNLICVTIAIWADMDKIDKAKTAVQAEYQRIGFDMPAMLKRLHITIDRGIYSKMPE